MAKWPDHFSIDPEVMVGKPVNAHILERTAADIMKRAIWPRDVLPIIDGISWCEDAVIGMRPLEIPDS
jgi:hypothetical protein